MSSTGSDDLSKSSVIAKHLDIIKLSAGEKAHLGVVTEADRSVAWGLYIELKTRITTQPLHHRAGDEEAALNSVHTLFQLTRDTLHKHGPASRNCGLLGMHLLNAHLRPFTARWHGRIVKGKLQHDDERREFRGQLQKMQGVLNAYVDLFYAIAQEGAARPKEESHDKGKDPDVFAHPIPFDRLLLVETPEGSKSDSGPILGKEQESIQARRADGKQARQIDGNDVPVDLVGVAFSGGGIRSATLALGVTQRLVEEGVLQYRRGEDRAADPQPPSVLSAVDYLSTVSGGGYFGSFLSTFLNDSSDAVGVDSKTPPFNTPEGAAESTAFRHLRNNSKYLLNEGIPKMLMVFIYGIMVSILALLVALIPLSLVWDALPEMESFLLKPLPVIGVGIGVSTVVSLLLFLSGKPKAAFYVFWFPGAAGAFILLVLTLDRFVQAVDPWWSLGPATVLTLLFFGAGFASLKKSPILGQVFLALSSIVTVCLLLMSMLALARIDISMIWINLLEADEGLVLRLKANEELILIAFSVLLATILWLINVNWITPHRPYRDSLAQAYLIPIKSKDRNGKPRAQKLSDLQERSKKAPYHLINGALNIPKSEDVDLRRRRSDFFLLSKHFCGSPIVGYYRTCEYEKLDPHLDVGTAMAISAAAFSAHLGVNTPKGASFWLTLLNVRLGYWLPNPTKLLASETLGPGFGYLLREMSGRMNEKTHYWNVSDGGHIENLAIYELLRRRCKVIIAVDGEADGAMGFGSLIKVMRYAKIDFGIDIKLDLADLRKNEQGYSRAHFNLGRICYPGGYTGYLLYIKSSVTGNEPTYVLDYKTKNPTFPHETTADQFFDEAQFEAYRALGYHMAEDLFRGEIIPKEEKKALALETWMNALIQSLLPDDETESSENEQGPDAANPIEDGQATS